LNAGKPNQGIYCQPNFTSWLRFSRAKEPYNVFAEMAPLDIGKSSKKICLAKKIP